MRRAAFEDRVGLAGTIALQMIGRADAGEPGADDENVEMFACHARHSTGSAADRPVTRNQIRTQIPTASHASPAIFAFASALNST